MARRTGSAFRPSSRSRSTQYGRAFLALSWREQDELLKSIHDAKPMAGAEEIWERMPVQRYWALLVQDCLEVYYAHPWAWDEIGFGGPAYPRAYMRLERGEPEPWEVEERRYEWEAPPDCRLRSERTGHRGAQRAPAAWTRRDTLKTPLGGAFEPPRAGRASRSGRCRRSSSRCTGMAETRRSITSSSASARRAACCLQRLARAGFKVLGIEAGPFWDTERDWVSDEAGSHKLYWEDLRITGGKNPLALGANNSGKGVGGGSVHWAAFTPRFHPSDFEVYTRDGVGADWPISYWDLKPYYELLELEMPVAGPAWFPWGDPHGYPFGPHPMGGVGNTLIRGCTKLGIGVSAGGPVAILSGSRGDRPHCIYRGFCIQGCKVGAKASTLITHVPDALENGAEIRDHCMVSRIHHDRKSNRVTGVSYYRSRRPRAFPAARRR